MVQVREHNLDQRPVTIPPPRRYPILALPEHAEMNTRPLPAPKIAGNTPKRWLRPGVLIQFKDRRERRAREIGHGRYCQCSSLRSGAALPEYFGTRRDQCDSCKLRASSSREEMEALSGVLRDLYTDQRIADLQYSGNPFAGLARVAMLEGSNYVRVEWDELNRENGLEHDAHERLWFQEHGYPSNE